MRNFLRGWWYKRVSRFWGRRSAADRHRRLSLPSFKPHLEALEERVVPTISVTGPSVVTPGSQVAYTINYTPTNFAVGDTNVTIQATLPAGFKALSATAIPNFPGGPTNPDNFSIPSQSSVQGSNVITFTNTSPRSVSALSADTFQIIALAPSNLVFPPAPGTVTETSTQDSSMIPSGVITVQTSSPTVTPVGNLSVTQVGPTSADAGTDALYTVTVANNGPSDSQNVTLLAWLINPNGGAAPGFDLAKTMQISGPDSFTFNPTTGTFTAATVGAGHTNVFQIAAAIPPNFTITNPMNPAVWSNVSVSSTTTLDPTAPHVAETKTSVTASTNLSVTTSGPPTIAAGTEGVYTVTITNNGPSTAQNVTLTDVLTGAGLSFDSALTAPLSNPDGFGAFTLLAPGSQSGTFTAAAMAPGSSDTFRVVVRVTSNAGANGSSFSTTASVSSTTADPVQTDNSATASTTLTNSADLSIVETLNPPGASPITEGTPFTYSLLLTNNGPSDAENVVVTFTLPPQLNTIAPIATLTNPGTGQTVTGVQSGNVLTFTIPSVSAAAGKNTFSGTVTVQGIEDGTVTSLVSVTSTTLDPNSANNASQVTTAVLEGPIVISTNNFDGTEFSNWSGNVASFTHANGLEPAGAFTATISWGDGSTSTGAVSQPGGTGTSYIVQGNHIYTWKGNYTVTVSILDDGNSTSANGSANIGNAPLPGGTFPMPMTLHVQEAMENLFRAPLSSAHLNNLDIALWAAELSIAHQLMSRGADASTAYQYAQILGEGLFDLYASFVSSHGTSLNEAVTDIATGLLIIGSEM